MKFDQQKQRSPKQNNQSLVNGGHDDLNVCLAEGPRTAMLGLIVLGLEMMGP